MVVCLLEFLQWFERRAIQKAETNKTYNYRDNRSSSIKIIVDCDVSAENMQITFREGKGLGWGVIQMEQSTDHVLLETEIVKNPGPFSKCTWLQRSPCVVVAVYLCLLSVCLFIM